MKCDDVRHEVEPYVTMPPARLLAVARQNLMLVCNSLRALIEAGDSGMLDQWMRARNAALVALSMYEPRDLMQGPPE
jgi:hypothetical protein